jgi:hypothetical protein
MGKSKIFEITRRKFLKIAGAFGALSVLNPLKLFAATPVSPSTKIAETRNDLEVISNGTVVPTKLLEFAQVTDIHICDNGNPMRFENLKAGGLVPLNMQGWMDQAITSTCRDQQYLSAKIWDCVIRDINKKHRQEPMAFVMNTGDVTDTNLDNELQWFIDIANGKYPTGYDTTTDSQGKERSAANNNLIAELDPSPEGFILPWYTTLGNHDTEYQGTANNVQNLLPAASVNTEDLTYQDETIQAYNLTGTTDSYGNEGHSISNPGPAWHGLANMPEPEGSYTKKEGYYSFDPNPYIHCIVLNTSNFNPEIAGTGGTSSTKETEARAVMDQRQFDWMTADIEANANKLCLIFSHGDPVNEQFADEQSDITTQELMDALCSHENVIAHINGHVHFNRIDPVDNGTYRQNGKAGYWNINTDAVAAWPNEWRRITIYDNKNGTGTIETRMFQFEGTDCPTGRNNCEACKNDLVENKYEDCYAAKKCLYVSYNDGGVNNGGAGGAEGADTDRNTGLLFAIPQVVSATIKDFTLSEQQEHDHNCFIATAAFGTIMEPEVITLRRFRDVHLLTNPIGRIFVKTYYRLSPPIAEFIAQKPILKAAVRSVLRPVVRLMK